jgi:hypothetical protein
VEKFLDASKIRYAFSRCDGPTLWDILWEVNNYRNGCGGHISDFIDRDIASRVKEMGPGGDFRESYEEYLKREDLEDTEDRREEYARDDVNDSVSSFYKREKPKSTRSKYDQPCYFDFIEDIDDDIEVALALGVVELSKSELARLNRIYNKTPDRYDKWRRVLCARKLVQMVESISDARHGDLLDVDQLLGLCPESFGPMVKDDKRDDCWRPDILDEFECPDCGARMSQRNVKAAFQYVMNGCVKGVDYHRYLKHTLSALDGALPGESFDDLPPRTWAESHLVTRLKFRSVIHWKSWPLRLVDQVPDYFNDAREVKALGTERCRFVGYNSPLSNTGSVLGFHSSGHVIMGNSHIGSEARTEPMREQLEECRDVLLRAGAVEADYGRGR